MKDTNNSRRRMMLPLTTVVGLGFGAFVAVSIGLVLGLSVSANFKNTFSLLNDKAILSTQALESQLRTHLTSIEDAVLGLKPHFDETENFFDSPERVLEDLRIALQSNSNLTSLAITTSDGRMVGAYRSPTGKIWRIKSDTPPPGIQPIELPTLATSDTAKWGALVKHETGLYANVSAPLTVAGQMSGTLTAAISMDELGHILTRQDEGQDNTVFVIADDSYVILHSDVDLHDHYDVSVMEGPGLALGKVDPVLAAKREPLDNFQKSAEVGIEVSFVEVGESDYIMMRTQLAGYSAKPLTIGQYYLGVTVSREVFRLSGSMFVGLTALVIAVLIAFLIGRRITRPLKYLALQSQRVGSLSLNEVEPLKRSRVTEIDQVALAFNSMVEGLKAMNTYVPRSLFVKLMRLGGERAAEAREAELTILFTDIAGFTTLSENLSAEETASLLNEHFAILVKAVEAEGGTVDKFLGDGMLAFWGAPDERKDHAEAAVRTARKIAHALHQANSKAAETGGKTLKLRIGIHTGSAVVGNVGALDRWNYTVVGDTVNATERLQALGKTLSDSSEITILASAKTIEQLPGEQHLTAVGSHALRGRSELMDVYELDPFVEADGAANAVESHPISAAE